MGWFRNLFTNGEEVEEMLKNDTEMNIIFGLAFNILYNEFPKKFKDKPQDFEGKSCYKGTYYEDTIEIWGNFNIKNKEEYKREIVLNGIPKTYKIILIKKNIKKENLPN